MKKYHQRCQYVTKKNLDLLLQSTPKSRRRPELTDEIRIEIAHTAYMAQQNRSYGAITALAEQYNISRQFAYNLLYTLQTALILSFSISEENARKNKRDEIGKILSLRFEGKSPLGGMSEVMKRFDMPNCSESYISQVLKEIGEVLPETQEIDIDGNFSAHSVADEIFVKSKPILMTAAEKYTSVGYIISKR